MTRTTIATMRNFGSISLPLILMSGENPIMPAEVIGIETFSCLAVIRKTFRRTILNALSYDIKSWAT